MRPKITALIPVVAAFLIGLFAVGCGDGESGSGASTPQWALRLPQGAEFGAWSPDGRLFALPARGRIELIGADGDTKRRIRVTGLGTSGFYCNCRLGWSEDGAEIHAVTRPGPTGEAGVVIVERIGGNPRTRGLGFPVLDAAWAPRGWPLALAPGTTIVQAGPPREKRSSLLRLDGLASDPRLLTRQRGEIQDPAFSPDGSRLVFKVVPERGGESLWTASGDSGKPQLLLEGLLNAYASWSPNGRELAVSGVLPPRKKSHLFLVSPTTGKVRRLSDQPIGQGEPAWTPDGRWITYVGRNSSVDKVRRDGADDKRLFERPGEEIGGLSWSPDGRHLVFTTRPIIPSG
jgi:WD40 repeat protein